jgi:hypothetical protein
MPPGRPSIHPSPVFCESASLGVLISGLSQVAPEDVDAMQLWFAPRRTNNLHPRGDIRSQFVCVARNSSFPARKNWPFERVLSPLGPTNAFFRKNSSFINIVASDRIFERSRRADPAVFNDEKINGKFLSVPSPPHCWKITLT